LTYSFRFVSLWEMLEINGSEFLHAYQFVCALVQTCQTAKDRNESLGLSAASQVEFVEAMDFLVSHCAALELR
jgi:hypothetical protein